MQACWIGKAKYQKDYPVSDPIKKIITSQGRKIF